MDWTTGCTVEQGHTAITELVTFHAGWWGRTRLNNMDWLVRRDMANWRKNFAPRWNALDEASKSALPESIIPIGEKLAHGEEEIFGRWSAVPQTLTHGDYHFKNTLFTPNGGSLLAVVDWSNLGASPGSTDLSYFVTHSLAAAARKEHEKELVRLYCDTLLKCGVSQCDFEACWDEYRLWALDIGMLWATIPKEGRVHIEIWDLLMSRLSSAIIELDADEFVV